MFVFLFFILFSLSSSRAPQCLPLPERVCSAQTARYCYCYFIAFLLFYTVLNNTSCTPRHILCNFGVFRIVTIASKSGKNIARSSVPVKLRRLKRENVALFNLINQTITTISERHVASITTQITKKIKKEKQIIESTMTNTIILPLYFPVRVAL